jgi:pimeloyl-ACP methyl ester carboxylesterase
MSITTIGNNLIHYEVLGRGQPILFIHDWLGSWRYWWPSMQAMSAQHRSFAFDLWGFGDSSRAPDLYTLDAYASMIDQFIDQLGVARPVYLIGHGLGAAVGLRYTVKHPENVEKLVSISLPVTGDYIHARAQGNDSDGIIKALGKIHNFPEIDSELRKVDRDAFARLVKEVKGTNFATDLAESPRPVLLLYGDQDQMVNAPAGEHDYLTESANSRYFVKMDCGHFPMLQDKTRFNRLLLDFFLAGDDLTQLAPKEYWSRRTR